MLGGNTWRLQVQEFEARDGWQGQARLTDDGGTCHLPWLYLSLRCIHKLQLHPSAVSGVSSPRLLMFSLCSGHICHVSVEGQHPENGLLTSGFLYAARACSIPEETRLSLRTALSSSCQAVGSLNVDIAAAVCLSLSLSLSLSILDTAAQGGARAKCTVCFSLSMNWVDWLTYHADCAEVSFAYPQHCKLRWPRISAALHYGKRRRGSRDYVQKPGIEHQLVATPCVTHFSPV